MSRAGETNGDGKAHKEGAEVHRRPGNRAEIGGGGEVKNSNDEQISEKVAAVAQGLEFLLAGWLQRSEAAGVPVADGTEE